MSSHVTVGFKYDEKLSKMMKDARAEWKRKKGKKKATAKNKKK